MSARLVRDRALETWRVAGAEHQVRPVRDQRELGGLLGAKLMEETREVLTATSRTNLQEELGDVLAVLQGIAHHAGIPWETVLETAQAKEDRSGPFKSGLVWDKEIMP